MAEEMGRALIKEMEEFSSDQIASVKQILKVMESELEKDSQADDGKEAGKEKNEVEVDEPSWWAVREEKIRNESSEDDEEKGDSEKQKSIRRQMTQSLKRKTAKRKNQPQILSFD